MEVTMKRIEYVVQRDVYAGWEDWACYLVADVAIRVRDEMIEMVNNGCRGPGERWRAIRREESAL